MKKVHIKSSVYPPNYQGGSRVSNPPVSAQGRSVYPEGKSPNQWENEATHNMSNWYAEHKVGIAHMTVTDMNRIDNMNRHLFNY